MKVVKAAAVSLMDRLRFAGLTRVRNQEKADIPLAEIGYRWLQHHSALSPVDGIVFGSSTLAHLKSNMASVEKGPLPEGVVSALDVAYKIVGHDAPQYWR
jgi:aflatoxin B1 aldehyde reductase